MEKLHDRLNPQNLEHFFVLEGGGPFGIGYEAGFLDEFRARGADGKKLHVLGTSAGSWVGGMMAADVHFEDVATKPQIKLFQHHKPNYMRGYADEIFEDKKSSYVNATTSRLKLFDRPELEVWNGDEHTLAEMAWASSTVPGLFPPAFIDGRAYVDGAVAGLSAGYAHLAPKAGTLVVIGALAKHLKVPVPIKPFRGVPGWVLSEKSRFDRSRWKKKNPLGKVIYIRPNHEISEMVKTPTDIFDFDIAREVYWKAREQAADLLDNPQERPKKIYLQQQLRRLAAQLCELQPAS